MNSVDQMTAVRQKPESTSKLIRHRHAAIMEDLKQIMQNINTKCWKISHWESPYTGFHIDVSKSLI